MAKTNLFETILGKVKELQGSFEKTMKESFSPDTIIDQMMNIDEMASKVTKSFGQGRENIYGINKGLTEAITNVTLLGGSWDDVGRIQLEIAENLGRNVISTSETIESVYKTSQVVGVSTQLLVTNFKDIGFSAGKIESQMQGVVDASRQLGVNATAVSKQALSNMSEMNKFNFQGGVEGLGKMAAQAVSLRVDMKSTLNLAEKLFNPESAINMAAAMQRLGVAQSDLLDPLRLMELGQNDPAELQNQIAQMTKQFVQLNEKGQFEIMPGGKRRLMEISSELGIGYGELTKMAIASSELDDKLMKIRFPDNTFSEEQQKFIANIAEMDKDGEYKIKVDGEDLGVEEAMNKFKDAPKKLEELMNPKSIEELAKDQLSTSVLMLKELEAIRTIGFGVAGSKTGGDIVDVTRAAAKTAGSFTRAPLGKDVKQQSKIVDDVYDAFAKLPEILSGEGSFEEKLKQLITVGSDLGTTLQTQIGENLKSSANEASSSLKKLSENGNKFYEIVENTIKIFNKGETSNTSAASNSEPVKINAKDLLITTLPEDKFVLGAGTNIDGSKGMSNPTPSEININLTHDIKGAPSNIDVTQLAQMMTNADITNVIIKEIKKVSSNNGLTEQSKPF